MFVEVSRQNDKLQEERKLLQEEIARIKDYLQPVSTSFIPNEIEWKLGILNERRDE